MTTAENEIKPIDLSMPNGIVAYIVWLEKLKEEMFNEIAIAQDNCGEQKLF